MLPAQQNLVAQDMLLRMPGVSARGAKDIMAAVPSLAALARLSKVQLVDILGAVNASLLHRFLHSPYPVPGSDK